MEAISFHLFWIIPNLKIKYNCKLKVENENFQNHIHFFRTNTFNGNPS